MLFDLIKSALMGMIQGIAEWLPISSGGHLMLFNALLPLKNVGEDFWPLYDTVIQLGSILAVVALYFHRLNPFALSKSRQEKRETWEMWFKIIVAVIPSGLIGVALNDWIDAHLDGPAIIAVALIVYGVVFLLLDRLEEGRHARRIGSIRQMSYRTAFLIGCFQVLALIPGTSRSGSTIIGALLLGLTRTTAVEFSFFMAIPTMLGASGLKCLRFFTHGNTLSGSEAAILGVGFALAFIVSLLAIRALVQYIRTHSFRVFGFYRIALGAVVLALLAAGVIGG